MPSQIERSSTLPSDLRWTGASDGRLQNATDVEPNVDKLTWAFKYPGRKKYKALFHKGSFKKSIKVWYSKAQFTLQNFQLKILHQAGKSLAGQESPGCYLLPMRLTLGSKNLLF